LDTLNTSRSLGQALTSLNQNGYSGACGTVYSVVSLNFPKDFWTKNSTTKKNLICIYSRSNTRFVECAKEIKEALSKIYPLTNVILLPDTSPQVEQLLTGSLSTFDYDSEQETALFYFGHGANKNGQWTNESDYTKEGMIKSFPKKCSSQHKILAVLDSCHSGAAVGEE